MIAGYRVLDEIYRGRKRIVYRGERDQDGTRVIIKTLRDDFPPEKEMAGLKREYEILCPLRIDGIAKVYGLEWDHHRPALILEDIGGAPLRSLIDSKKVDLLTFLKIAIPLSGAVAGLHQKNIIHKDITPNNVVVNLESGRVNLIDFSIASRLPNENQKVSHPSLLEGTLAYLSPEQTGRMNRAIDYRTDFYSLGVTFYEMVTGRLPLSSADPLELIHFHIAKRPEPPQTIRPDLPEAISDIIMRLLAKTAEERYQSAYGIKADLETCLAQWQSDGMIGPFIPGRGDFSDRFQIPQKLYGREDEITTLMAAFERVSRGRAEMMFVSGYSGIGKSALVHEVHKPIVRQKGYFISGKFDQFKRDIPYSAVIQAFQELVRQLLTESEAQIGAWKERLTQALGPNGEVIIDVIPEVEWIMGGQPLVPQLPPVESQNRFNLVFQRFIQVFTQKEHPLVLFLDDLQWADSATLKLLQALMVDPNMSALFVIGAYRDNEVHPAHPLLLTLAEIEKSGAALNRIHLKSLDRVHLNQMIAETLRCGVDRSEPLAEEVLRKTDGNPFFVTQFLKSLYQEGLFTFDLHAKEWRFDLDRIQGMEMTDNVVTLMAGKIQKFSEPTQQALKLAACIGNQFDLETLSIVHQKSRGQTGRDLWEAIREGLILPIGGPDALIEDDDREGAEREAISFKFSHDRVQQAAYALIPDDQKKGVHLKVGRLMLRHSDESAREEKRFDIVNHLNIGVEWIADPEERVALAELNLQAGRKAKSSTAYKPALNYLRTGRTLLPEAPWTSHYDLTFSLHRELAECEYLNGHFDQAEQYFDLLLLKGKTKIEKAEIYNMRIIQHENRAKYIEAIEAGKESLGLFGLVLPETTDEKESALSAEMQAIQKHLGDRPIEDLINLPEMTDPEMKMSMKLLMTVWAPAYIAGDGPLTALLSARMVRLSLEHGNTEASAYGYVTHAITVGSGRGDFKSGYEFGRLALSVNEKFNDLKLKAKIHHMFSCFVNFWRKPIRTCFPHSKEAYRAGLETGDFAYATYGIFHESWYGLLVGNDLRAFQKEYGPNLSFLMQIKNDSFAAAQQVILHWGLSLQGLTARRGSLTDETFDETVYVKTYQGVPFFETFYFVTQLHLLFTFEHDQEAREMADKAEGVVQSLMGTLWTPLLSIYQALTLAALYPSLPAEAQQAFWKKLESIQERMNVWAENAPENFLQDALLISAEMAKIGGKEIEAIDFYEGAIRASEKNGSIRQQALANELYAKFWLHRGNERIARTYMTDAHNRYGEWGALAKVKDLEEKYPLLLSQIHPAGRAGTADFQMGLVTIRRGTESLDLMTFLKGAQVISGEIELNRLLEKLMRIVIENAGAQKGILLLEKGGELFIEAEGSVDEEVAVVLHALPMDRSPHLSLAIVNYVKRTGESLVLADAGEDGRFRNDSYVARTNPKSILCIPILNQGKLTGILYLENNLTRGVFTPDRIELMKILSSQAAISIENARLYEEMKQEIAERKRAEEALRRAHDELEARVQERTLALSEANAVLKEQILERQYAEGALRESEARLSRVLESAMDAIITMDEGERIVLFNAAAEKVFRSPSAEAIGRPFGRFLSDRFRTMLSGYVQASAEGGETRHYMWAPEGLTALRADGEEFPIEATISQVEVGGRKLYTVILRDINDRKRAEAELNRLHLEKVYLQEELKIEHNFEEIVGTSKALKKVLQSVEKVATTDSIVLVTGETGTGKELIARAIHNLSSRKKGVLVKVNCGALPGGLIESELFGHEKGAFTGATSRRKGRFELADGGTIFLDEVGELPLETQTKLLRILQEQELERVGGTETLKVDVRVIAATNRNLEEAVRLGAFRADLFYRLHIFPIHLPPLRERAEDLPLLVDYFSRKFSRRLGKRIDSVSPQALERLIGYDWPGNVRELANIMERAVILCEGPIIQPDQIHILGTFRGKKEEIVSLEEAERLHIRKALEKTGWVVGGPKGAAALLGINRTTLLSRMKKLGIDLKR